MMIHHQLLPLKQLQMPLLLHIEVPPEYRLAVGFTAHSMVFRLRDFVQESSPVLRRKAGEKLTLRNR